MKKKAFKPKSFYDVLEMDCCRFITGDPDNGATFCGNKKHERRPYCKAHTDLCYKPLKASSRKSELAKIVMR